MLHRSRDNCRRYIHIYERDPSFPRDKDGCPTMNGTEWLIDPTAITAIELVEDRGGVTDATIYVRGVRKPIRCCESGDYLTTEMAELGMLGSANECTLCGRPCAAGSSHCRACEGMISACEDGAAAPP